MATHRHDHHVAEERAGEAGDRPRGHGSEHHVGHGSTPPAAVPATGTPGIDARGDSGPAGVDHSAMDHQAMDHGVMGHGAMGHGAMAMASPATGPQVAAVAALSVLALVVAAVFSISYANLTLSARDVGGLVMPPGMIMTRETSAEAMRDMAAVDLRQVAFAALADGRGDQPLEPRLEGSVKVFDLETLVIRRHILPNVHAAGYAFNGQVLGPRLRIS